MNNATLEAALEYRNKYGFSVIPCHPENKKPLVNWLLYQKARASEKEIREWWQKFPLSMVAIVTGKLSGVMVLDGDDDESIKKIESLLPENFLTVTAQTPRGQHLYLQYHNGVRNSSKALGYDVRGEGGYVVAPPSIKTDGKKYIWIIPPDSCPIAEAPSAVLAALFGNKAEVKTDDRKSLPPIEGSLFEQGNRDKALFFTACSLLRGGMGVEQVREVIYKNAEACNPPFSEKEAEIKLQSAIKATGKEGRSWIQDVENYVSMTDGMFYVKDVCFALGAKSPEDMAVVRSTLQKLRDKNIVEKVGTRDGSWRRIDKDDVQVMDFLHAPTTEFKIKIPLSIHEYVSLYPGNIVVIAGSKSAGKTAFMLNVVKENQGINNWKAEDLVYMNSEMGATELRNRLVKFEMPLEHWSFTPISRGNNWSDLITQEKKIFIVDFIEITDDFYKIAGEIRLIHDKLKEGICFIALHKDPNATYGRGGTFSIEKSRLYITLDHFMGQDERGNPRRINLAKIVDAKSYKGRNPRGWIRTFKLHNGSIFVPECEWHDPEIGEPRNPNAH